jgi:hypothetical protein
MTTRITIFVVALWIFLDFRHITLVDLIVTIDIALFNYWLLTIVVNHFTYRLRIHSIDSPSLVTSLEVKSVDSRSALGLLSGLKRFPETLWLAKRDN